MPDKSAKLPRLEVGDRVPNLGWLDPDGERFNLALDAYAGRPSILLICPAAGAPGAARDLARLRDLHDEFRVLGTQIFAVTAEPDPVNVSTSERLGLPFPILVDAGFAIGHALGLAAPREAGRPAVCPTGRPEACILVVDPNQRIVRQLALTGGDDPGGDPVQAALSLCREWAASQDPIVVTMQPPVLIVPNVLSPEHCSRLIRFWETGDRYEGGVANVAAGGNVPIEKVKVRGDVALADLGPEARELFDIFKRRLLLEIQKVHNFRATRAETLRLGCYDAANGGHFVPHRDDTTPYTAHRRFAMSLNLNTGDYEGGYLRFPEYGPQLYAPATGGAVVFSCSLLHEATPVTAGRRFVLLGFFYGEVEQAQRERVHAERRARETGSPVWPGPPLR